MLQRCVEGRDECVGEDGCVWEDTETGVLEAICERGVNMCGELDEGRGEEALVCGRGRTASPLAS